MKITNREIIERARTLELKVIRGGDPEIALTEILDLAREAKEKIEAVENAYNLIAVRVYQDNYD